MEAAAAFQPKGENYCGQKTWVFNATWHGLPGRLMGRALAGKETGGQKRSRHEGPSMPGWRV